MSDIARLILEQGRIAAQARERSGALWGNAISDISRVPGQVMNAYQQRQDRQQALALAANREARDTAGAADEHQLRVAQLESMRQKQAADWAEKLRVSNADVPTVQSEIDAQVGKLWTPEEATALKQAAATPEGAQRIITRLAPVREAKPAEPFTLKPGETRFGGEGGQPIASVPAPAARPVAVGPGSTLVSPETNQPVFTAPTAPKAPGAGTIHDTANGLVRIGDDNSVTPLGVKGYHPVAAGVATGDTGKLTPEAVEYMATQHRILGNRGLPTRLDENAKAAIINASARQTRELGQSPVQAIQKQAAYAGDSKALAKMQSMSAAAESFETKAIAQAGIVADLSQKVSRTQIPLLNAALLSGKKELLGDPDTQLLFNAITTFTSEYAKIMEGSTGSAAASSDSARKASAELIKASLNKDTLAKTLDLMQREMRLSIQGYDATIAHITDRMGGAPTAAPAAPAAPVGVTVTSPSGRSFPFADQAAADRFVADAKAKGLWK